MKNKIIKFLGGYTKKEYLRVERKYEALLDSKTDSHVVEVCNEHLYKMLKDLNEYAKDLYGCSSWEMKMYNVIHNNMLRIFFRYIDKHSSTIYSLDTTLDEFNQFKNILKQDEENNRRNNV